MIHWRHIFCNFSVKYVVLELLCCSKSLTTVYITQVAGWTSPGKDSDIPVPPANSNVRYMDFREENLKTFVPGNE